MKIRYIVMSIIIVIMFFSVYSYATTYTVSNVLIEGLQNVKLKDVLSVINLKKGEFYSENKAREDVASILRLGYFNNIEIRFDKDKGNLVFIVTENPYVERIVFKGNSAFSTFRLKLLSVLKEKNYYDVSKVEETKEKISTLYLNEGYLNCKIEVYPTVNTDTNKMTVTFLINENKKIVIEDIKIEGVISFKEKEILKVMKTRSKKAFREDIYQADLESIEAFYKNNGFMDYQFISLTTTYNDAKTKMFLTLEINEGNKYKIGSVTYNGNFVVDDKEMEKMIKVKKGQIFNQSKITETVKRIRKLYSGKEYPKAVIEPYFYKEDVEGVVNINFLVEEGEVISVRNIYINGLVSTKDRVIRREMLLKPGAVLTRRKLRRSIEKIYNLGFIDEVKCDILNTGDPGVVDLEFSVKDSPKHNNISLNIGYSSISSFTGRGEFSHFNMLGLGQKLNLFCSLAFSSKEVNYGTSWEEPYFFGKNMSLLLKLYDTTEVDSIRRKSKTDNNKKIGKDITRKTFEMMICPRIDDRTRLFIGGRYEDVDFHSYGKYLKPYETDRLLSFLCGVLYDLRDYVFDPSKGSIHSVNLSVTNVNNLINGNKNFIKGTASSAWFFPTFYRRLVLSVNLSVGAIMPFSDQIPVYERFHLGRPKTLRCYDRDEIDPDKGGEIMGLMNIEYKFPICPFQAIFGKERALVQIFLFYDIGVLLERKKGKLSEWEGKGGHNVGVGIRIFLPIAIEFDLGYVLTKKELRFNFSVGG